METTAIIEEIRSWQGVFLTALRSERLTPLQPGQYALIYSTLALAVQGNVFASEKGRVVLAVKTLPAWQPGETVRVRLPLGKGFQLPPAARQVALLALQPDGSALFPLLRPALRQGAAVVWCGRQPPLDLPVEVEIAPIEETGRILAWADYAAACIEIGGEASLPLLFGFRPQERHNPLIEVHLQGDFICGGMAACGVCAVHTRKGWVFACQDGPVFNYNQLEL